MREIGLRSYGLGVLLSSVVLCGCPSVPLNPDIDGDGLANGVDNCPNDFNPGQEDIDGNGTGDVCDTVAAGDRDGDGIRDTVDNCVAIANNDQLDTDRNGIGDACEANPPIVLLLAPSDGRTVPVGNVQFLWLADAQRGALLQQSLVISDQRQIFGRPLLTTPIPSTEDQFEFQASALLEVPGVYFWGVETSDGVGTIRTPGNGAGISFEVTGTGEPTETQDVVLLCPAGGAPARSLTTFQWALAPTLVPARTTLFVGRSGTASPFGSPGEAPLRAIEVTPATALSRTLTAAEALPVGRELSWGLRMEAADGAVFTTLAGQPIRVAENVPPSGRLLAPVNDATLSDDTETFFLRGAADADNCEDPLEVTLFFEFLGERNAPQALLDSPIQIVIPLPDDFLGGFEADLVGRIATLGLRPGRWSWGAVAFDGTDRTTLADGPAGAPTFKTFIRDPRPEFGPMPSLTAVDACGPDTNSTAAIHFGFDDQGGFNPVDVTLTFAAQRGDVFLEPSATMELGTNVFGQSPEDVTFFLWPTETEGCPIFGHGPGFYGIELNDGVNDPVRAIVEYPGPDCNQNGLVDDEDLSAGRSMDCNRNSNPDECEILTTSRAPGGPFYCVQQCAADVNANGVPDSCESSGPPPPPPCMCPNDGLFCNGVESCVGTTCTSSGNPCPQRAECDEASDRCILECEANSNCDDDDPCTVDRCLAGNCGYQAIEVAPPTCSTNQDCDAAGAHGASCVGGICKCTSLTLSLEVVGGSVVTDPSSISVEAYLISTRPLELKAVQLDMPCSLAQVQQVPGTQPALVAMEFLPTPNGPRGPGSDGSEFLFGSNAIAVVEPTACMLVAAIGIGQTHVTLPAGQRRYLGTFIYEFEPDRCSSGDYPLVIESRSFPTVESDRTRIRDRANELVPFNVIEPVIMVTECP